MPRHKSPATPVNSAFREWTRGVSFTLTMGKTQVATLVSAHLSQEQQYPPIGHDHKLVSQFVTAMNALEARGLIAAHIWKAEGKERHELQAAPFGRKWQVTEAGEHVVALLKLSGIYDELRKEFEAVEANRRRPRIA